MAILTAEARPGQEAFARYEAHHKAEAKALRTVLQSAQAGATPAAGNGTKPAGSSFPGTG